MKTIIIIRSVLSNSVNLVLNCVEVRRDDYMPIKICKVNCVTSAFLYNFHTLGDEVHFSRACALVNACCSLSICEATVIKMITLL